MSRTPSTWALVTGASKGIGARTAVTLAKAGWNVIIGYGRDEAGANAVAAECQTYNVETKCVGADLANDISPLVAVIDEVGGIGVLVNNAGITKDGLAMSMDDETFAAPINVNVNAAFAITRAALRAMLRARSGRIIFISSVVGLHGNVGQANYAASKGALVAMAKSLAKEVGKRGITVNAVAPGFIATDMTEGLDTAGITTMIPSGRLGDPQDIANGVAFLASPEASYINGTVLQIDGGLFA